MPPGLRFRAGFGHNSSAVRLDSGGAGMSERCGLCGCQINRSGKYATPTVQGRSHATEHHYIAERFFGRSQTRPREQRTPIFDEDPWGAEGQKGVFCYECHEELLHNPVLLPEDIRRFAELVAIQRLDEDRKPEGREKIAGRIKLFHQILAAGLRALLGADSSQS